MPKKEETQERYFEGTGRRKTAVARVRITPSGVKNFSINGKPIDVYFQDVQLRQLCQDAFSGALVDASFAVTVKVLGGGLHAQAEAIRHGISRALLLWQPTLKTALRGLGYLKRDSRMRERKKFGLRRARRARQWRKR